MKHYIPDTMLSTPLIGKYLKPVLEMPPTKGSRRKVLIVKLDIRNLFKENNGNTNCLVASCYFIVDKKVKYGSPIPSILYSDGLMLVNNTLRKSDYEEAIRVMCSLSFVKEPKEVDFNFRDVGSLIKRYV